MSVEVVQNDPRNGPMAGAALKLPRVGDGHSLGAGWFGFFR